MFLAYSVLMRHLGHRRSRGWALERLTTIGQACLAALGPTFNRVADLAGPMKEVAGLRDPMVRLSALKGSLDQVAKLDKPMSDVARLEEPLQAVGQLSRPVSALTRLPPVPLAASVILTILAFFLLLFLTIWGAVRLALRHRPA